MPNPPPSEAPGRAEKELDHTDLKRAESYMIRKVQGRKGQEFCEGSEEGSHRNVHLVSSRSIQALLASGSAIKPEPSCQPSDSSLFYSPHQDRLAHSPFLPGFYCKFSIWLAQLCAAPCFSLEGSSSCFPVRLFLELNFIKFRVYSLSRLRPTH